MAKVLTTVYKLTPNQRPLIQIKMITLQTKRKFCQELSIFFKKMTFYSDRNNQRYLEKEDQPEAISVK